VTGKTIDNRAGHDGEQRSTSASVDVRPADERFRTDLGWLDSRHSFSFGPHRDPTNTGHGLLIVSNDDVVAPGGGFGSHPHRDMEIVAWVLSGELEHHDSAGHHGVITPGLAQRMSAGSGIVHSEMNHSSTEPVHFVQMWVVSDVVGIEPEYEQSDVSAALATGRLVPVASGMGHDGSITIHQSDAAMWAGREGGQPLGTGDAARLTNVDSPAITVSEDAEIIVWETRRKVVR
jgi:redox-sensitive bicupin YhaK (pirin superfamily)